MTIFNTFNRITDEYMVERNHTKFLTQLKDLQKNVDGSVDNGSFGKSFIALKNSIEILIKNTENKISGNVEE